MITLAIDTASNNCAVAIVEDGKQRARVSETIGKGHAEKLVGQITLALQQSELALAMVDKFIVNIGPGSFTGVRIGVSTARALSLALQKPAIGVSSLEAIAYEAQQAHTNRGVTALIDAGRDMVYRQDFCADLKPLKTPYLQTRTDCVLSLMPDFVLSGPAANLIASMQDDAIANIYVIESADVLTYAALGALKDADGRPKPLYLRDADAKPQTGYALPRTQA